MAETEIFFPSEYTQRTIQVFLGRLATIKAVEPFEQGRNKYINLILNNMLRNSDH